ncbi:universal stress protein [Desulfovibrio cuneatus]|uniref:universal stress protein n=1 Tax=Desulfovibrio cuneatus TaxID=159728 RepID=UPI00041976DC|nr:universal stress protein [Desulfovibrio cuneatus]
MKKIAKILCAVDFSQYSEQVAEYAASLAKAFGAEIIVVYAAPDLAQYDDLHVSPATLEGTLEEIFINAEKSMENFVPASFKDIKTQGVVVTGDPAEEIIEMANSSDADMIIMGTHGRKGIERILFGSVAEQVVKSATIPVLTIHPTQ